jgi:hypothetical protein
MRVHPVVSALIVFLLLAPLLPSVGAYSTAWCGSCHQFVVVNDGVFAFNGSSFQDLTWELQAKNLKREEFMDFIQTLGVANAGDLTLFYFFPYDMLYMGVYNGTLPVVMKPVLSWYVGGVWDFVKYNGSVFFVASTGVSPHSSSDEVYRLDLKTFRVTAGWDLSWDARDRIAPQNAGNSPYAWVKLGLDDGGRLWARVDMMDPNTTVYYLYNGTNFTPVNASPRLHIPGPKPSFRLAVQTGLTYNLPWLLPPYTPVRYVLVKDGRERDVTGELLSFAYGVKPFKALYGFWNSEKKEWVVSFDLYGLPVTYIVNGSCRKPLIIRDLPLEVYNGSYVLLRNGTLSWRNYTVKLPFEGEQSSPYSENDVELRIYMKNGHPIVFFSVETYENETSLAYEVVDKGFMALNTTNDTTLGVDLVPPWFLLDSDGPNNVTGTLVVNDVNKTAYLITDTGRIPVNLSVANAARAVAVGNGTFLLLGRDDAYIVPPYDKPIDVLPLPVCGQQSPTQKTAAHTRKESDAWEGVLLVTALAAIGVFLIRRRG